MSLVFGRPTEFHQVTGDTLQMFKLKVNVTSNLEWPAS